MGEFCCASCKAVSTGVMPGNWLAIAPNGGADNLPVPQSCRAAFVLAGEPRSGSNLMYQMIDLALQLLAPRVRILKLPYWNRHIHAPYDRGSEKRTEAYESDLMKVQSLQQDEIILLKTHEFWEPLVHACNSNSLIIRVDRHPVDQINSFHKIWAKEKSIKELIDMLLMYSQHDRCWGAHAVQQIYMHYEQHLYRAAESVWARRGLFEAVARTLKISKADPSPFLKQLCDLYVNKDASYKNRDRSKCEVPHLNPDECLEPLVAENSLFIEDTFGNTAKRIGEVHEPLYTIDNVTIDNGCS